MNSVRKVLKSEYRSRLPQGDRLGKVAKLVDWEAFGPALEPLFKNTGEGRPHEDVVLMTKAMVLQSWYGLADEQIEGDCNDRLTFMNFLGYPSKVPDARKVWLFRERIAKEPGKEKEVWDELQRQPDRYRVRVKQGKVKDAVFVELGGWRMEGQHGPVVEVAPHKGYAQDSTIIDADPGAPTEEELKRLKEIEEKKWMLKEQRQQQKKREGGVTASLQLETKPEQPQENGAPFPPAIVMTTTEPKPRGTRRRPRGAGTARGQRSAGSRSSATNSTPRTSSPAGSSQRLRSPPRRPTTAPWTSQRRGRSASGPGLPAGRQGSLHQHDQGHRGAALLRERGLQSWVKM